MTFTHACTLFLLCTTLLSLTSIHAQNASSVITLSANHYPIDWSLVPTTQPTLSIPDNTELGPCICDLTVGNCDDNCVCDADCSLTEQTQFITTLNAGQTLITAQLESEEVVTRSTIHSAFGIFPVVSGLGPVDQSVPTCLDPDLVTINQRGALTVGVVNNMLCVTQNNNPSLGTYLNPSLTITDTQFVAAVTNEKYLYEITNPLDPAYDNPLSVSTPNGNYYVDSIIKAARADSTTSTLYPTHGGQFVVPAAGEDGECSDGNYMRYSRSEVNTCRRTLTNLQTACVSGGLLSGTRYVMNLKIGKTRTPSTATPSQYESMNVTSVYYVNSTSGLTTFVGYEPYLGNTTTSSGSFTFPEPTWNAAAGTCDNVLSSVTYTITHEASGQISTTIAPAVTAYVTSLSPSSTGEAYINQQYSTIFQLYDNVVSTSGVVLRPRSGNPGYLTGFPVLSGTLVSQSVVVSTTSTVTKQSIEQDIGGLTVLPIASDGTCTLSTTATRQPVTFGQNSKFGCYLPLNLAALQTACTTGVLSYFGNVSMSFGIWGSSDFTHVNEWITKTIPTAATSTWDPSTRSCTGLSTALNIEFVTVDAGAFKNPQTRILDAKFTYSTSTWRFSLEDQTASQLFPVFATISFIHLPNTDVTDYTPSSPPLLPKFPNDLLYPLYIQSSAPRTVSSNNLIWIGLGTIGMTWILRMTQLWA